ncbi:hypothetical protein ACH5RR_041364 [Cinchona calisaya]|uniref:Uncharacterized protein n=1 Tax=Cinchona calisaya TaxID=153742 RepID=A0ABD2XYL4_9GENT
MKVDVVNIEKECDICQRNKLENTPYLTLLQPLPIPSQAWSLISMNFIETLPLSKGYDTILVVIDRLNKFCQFLPLFHPFTSKDVAKVFLDNVFKLHGLPDSIVFDREVIC